jgi:ribosomal protein S12 methylthiotransferase
MDTWEQRPNPRTPVDSSRGTALTTLLRQLNAIEGDFWIRLLYTHPAHWSDELIKTIAECPKVARYIDIPLQHVSDHMLGRMQRETSGDYIRSLIARIRAGIPGIAVRTTFIVGFPGETQADVDELCEFIRDAKFERLGVFRYSAEDGTRAAKMDEQLTVKVKESRWHQTMALQQEIAAEVSKSYVGKIIRVLVELVYTRCSDHSREFGAQIHLELPGPDIIVREDSDDLYKSIDILVDKVDRQLRRRHRLDKEKRNHPHPTDLGDLGRAA